MGGTGFACKAVDVGDVSMGFRQTDVASNHVSAALCPSSEK